MILPFAVALLGILSHTYDLNPILVFCGLSEMVRHLSPPL